MTTTITSDNQSWETAAVMLEQGMHFVGTIDQYQIDLDAAAQVGGSDAGPQPLRLLLLGLAGCTAMDVIAILRKKRQQVENLRVEVRGQRAAEHPRVYERIDVVYHVQGIDIEPLAVERAIELSESRYCSAMAMLRQAAAITSKFKIEEVPTGKVVDPSIGQASTHQEAHGSNDFP